MTTLHNLAELLDHLGADTPFHLGRSLYKYTDCGPWTVFVCNSDVYYEDTGADCPPQTFENLFGTCTAIRIGSIVEGSDVEVGPETLIFPFTADDLDDVVQGVNDEAVFYWKRDNCLHGTWRNEATGEKHLFLDVWGDIDWDDDSEPAPLVTDEMRNWLDEQSPGEYAEQAFDTDAGRITLALYDTSDLSF